MMRRAEFNWQRVLAAVTAADLSDRFASDRKLNPDPRSSWPSPYYRSLHNELSSRLVSPPPDPPRPIGITVEEVERAADALIAELASATPPDPVAGDQWEAAARSLQRAKRIARQTRLAPTSGLFPAPRPKGKKR